MGVGQGALSSPWAFRGRIKAIGSSIGSSFLSTGDSSVFQNYQSRLGKGTINNSCHLGLWTGVNKELKCLGERENQGYHYSKRCLKAP